MNDLKKRILMELFVTPITMIPSVLGITLMAIGYVFPALLFLGFVSCVLGFGALVVNLVFNMKGISQRALKEWRREEKKKQSSKLNSLDKKLLRTKEKEDEQHLRNLRQLYESFCDDTAAGKISENTPPDMLAQIDEIFNVCVHSLENSYDLWKTVKNLSGDLKKSIEQQRKEVIADVGESVKEMANAINEIRGLKFKNKSDELQKVRDKLDRSLKICRYKDKATRDLSSMDHSLDKYAKEYDIE